MSSSDPFGIVSSSLEVQKAWGNHPNDLVNRGRLFEEQWNKLCSEFFLHGLTGKPAAASVASPYDERFQDPIWSEAPFHRFIKEAYLLCTHCQQDLIYETPDIDEKTKKKAAFWGRQMLNAMAPNNLWWMNPKAVSRFWETGGQSLFKGIQLLLEDVSSNEIKMVNREPFQVGVNLAATPGKVVFRNELMELIQYLPATETVHPIPIVFIPPWINRYYILDLSPESSLVRFLTQQGYTVFMISWKNPPAEMRETTFEDYVFKGAYPAIQAAMSICKTQQVDAVGYCIGGTALSCLLAWLNGEKTEKEEKGDRERKGGNSKIAKAVETCPIRRATLLTTLTDFASPGDVEVFIDEQSITEIERLMKEKGYLDGANVDQTFRTLRSNSLIWHYVVTRYLCGEEPPPFDVLYWNTDGTRLPETMHSFYLREFYLKNKLREQGGVTLNGRALDLRDIKQPLYLVGAEQDHIAPWKEVFKLCGLVKGPVRYVLATSGHIQGVISQPVTPPKRRYWVGEAQGAKDAKKWQEAQEKVPGSWWMDWIHWLEEGNMPLVAPPSMGNKQHPILGDAPGSYVLEK